jgi:Ca2+-binding EF-hand superfamily protein
VCGSFTGSGHLDTEEFFDLLNGMNFGLEAKDITSLQEKADKDKDGSITFSEFAPAAEKFLKELFRAQVNLIVREIDRG